MIRLLIPAAALVALWIALAWAAVVRDRVIVGGGE